MTHAQQAYAMGKDHGKAAGSWVLDGNSSEETARRILAGIEDGNPEILDMQPSPLSGEWADEPVSRDIYDAVGTDQDSDPDGQLLDAYESGYAEGFWAEVERSARAMLP